MFYPHEVAKREGLSLILTSLVTLGFYRITGNVIIPMVAIFILGCCFWLFGKYFLQT